MLAGTGRDGRSGGANELGPRLRCRWLGGREILLDGVAVHLESAKTEALLAFVVLNAGPQSRSRLTTLLWPELPEERASAGLRRALWDLKRKLAPRGAPFALRISRGEAEVDPEIPVDLDVRSFLDATGRADDTAAEEAAALYRGELLEGLAVSDAPAFEEWLLGERESLRLLDLSVYRRLVASCRERGDVARALEYARRLLALDPWLEEGHRNVAELLVLSGRRGAAIRQLEACRRVLADELGTAPSRETVELEGRLRQGPSVPCDVPATARSLGGSRNNLPLVSAPFVGRARELEEIARHLADPECRLLTLLGPGGAGKTRLAIQAAARATGAATPGFPDGVVFVSFSERPGTSGLAEATARVLELEGSGRDDPADRVLAALRDARLLLVLDGFEKRLDDAPLLARLLAGAPDVKALVSSRERLGLAEEWVLAVGGLETPAARAGLDPSRSDALRLFLSAARRARVGFQPGPADLDAAAEICRAVGGLPLAIEIAAGWVHALSPTEVAAQLARGPALLATPRRGERGAAGLRGVFEEAVSRLDAEERRVLRALSVFVGGMTWEAAAEVGPARPETIRSLSDRAFLRLDASSGRYALHEVLRAFAAEELAASAEEEAEAGRRHADHFARFLGRLAPAPRARIDRESREALAAELENLQAAWSRAEAAGNGAFLSAALPALAAAHLAWGTWSEGERLADEAARAGVGPRALVLRAAFRLRLGRLDAAEADVEEALRRLDPADVTLRTEALLHAGHAALLRGRLAIARETLDACIGLARAGGGAGLLAEALGRLGSAVLDQGRHVDARPYFEESLRVSRSIGNCAGTGVALVQLGLADYFAGELGEAEGRFREALALARAEGSRPGVSRALEGLGFVSEDRGALDVAADFYRESLAACRQNGDRYRAARCLMLLGEVERKRGATASARDYYEEGLALAKAVGSTYVEGLLEGNLAYLAAAAGQTREALARARAALAIWRETGSDTVGLPVLVALAEVAVCKRETSLALALLGHVLSHPGNRQDHELESERVLAKLRREAPRANVEDGLAKGRGSRTGELADRALGLLEGLCGTSSPRTIARRATSGEAPRPSAPRARALRAAGRRRRPSRPGT